MYCDLHTHSVYSDGTLTPSQLVSEAAGQNLVIALTDHNTAAGLPAFLQEAQLWGVTAVAGVELSTVYEDRELHLLGLFAEPETFSAIDALTARYHRLKQDSVRAMVERLRRDGYAIDYDAICQSTPNGNLNRAHIASALVDKRYVNSTKDALRTLLREGGGYYEPPERLPISEALHFLREICTVPVLAHPLKELAPDALRQILPQLQRDGLLGMEVQHTSYDRQTADTALSIAAEFGLLPSGGSDFHGAAKPGVALGSGKGNVAVPIRYYEDLLQKKQQL